MWLIVAHFLYGELHYLASSQPDLAVCERQAASINGRSMANSGYQNGASVTIEGNGVFAYCAERPIPLTWKISPKLVDQQPPEPEPAPAPTP